MRLQVLPVRLVLRVQLACRDRLVLPVKIAIVEMIPTQPEHVVLEIIALLFLQDSATFLVVIIMVMVLLVLTPKLVKV